MIDIFLLDDKNEILSIVRTTHRINKSCMQELSHEKCIYMCKFEDRCLHRCYQCNSKLLIVKCLACLTKFIFDASVW